jgi:hypothetical protein
VNDLSASVAPALQAREQTHSQIELEVGRPLVAPDEIAFPRRLSPKAR